MPVPPAIARTRNQAKAHKVARSLAGSVSRTFGVRKYDARTFEIFPQRECDEKTLKAYAKLAAAFAKLEPN